MKAWIVCLLLVGAVVLTANGCRNRSQSATDTLQKAFAVTVTTSRATEEPVMDAAGANSDVVDTNNPSLGTYVEQTVNAMRTRDYAAAAQTLQALQQQPHLTPRQRIALQGAMENVQGQLAQKLQRGDPDARRAAEELRNAMRR
jgi:hypothetical protein